MSLEDCRSRLPGVALWRALGLPDYEKVSKIGGTKKEVKICSPFRADTSPSFSVFINPDGTVGGKDWSEDRPFNDFGLISAATGIPESDKKGLLKKYHELSGAEWEEGGKKTRSKPSAPAKPPREVEKEAVKQSAEKGTRGVKPKAEEVEKSAARPVIVAEYDYCAEDGEVLHQTLRYEPKGFRQRRKPVPSDPADDVKGGWVWKLTGGRLVPFNLPKILAAPGAIILLVEGEKDAQNLQQLLDGSVAGVGVVVSTLPMGCGKWRDEYAPYFKDRHVVVLADFDEPREDGSAAGFDGAVKVCDLLRDVARRVGLLELPSIWKSALFGTDASDWLESGREAGVTDDDLLMALVQAVRAARLPMSMVYDGVVKLGGRGGLILDEDMLAERLVADEGLLFSAAAFWRYDGNGLWQREVTTLRIEKKIRAAMRSAGGGELITKARVSSVLGLAKSVRHCEVERMNAQPRGMVCVENGMLDTRTGDLLPHREDYLMNTRIPHRWVTGSRCPNWLDWILERHPDKETRDCIQEIFGYCLAVDINFHVFFFFYGDGGTGKSTCVSVLEDLVGEGNRVSIQLEELDNAFMRSQLAGKSLYLCKELTTKSFAHIGLIKAIVSGDPIPVDVKYAQPYDFRPFGRMVMESNVIATTPDSSGGFSRRFVQIDWDRPIDRDKMDFNLLDKFKIEMPGVLCWAMEGLKRLRERGHFHLTAKSEESRDQLLRHRSQVASFVASGMVYEHEKCYVPTARVFEQYEQWCEEFDVVPFYREQNSFMRELMSKKPEWRARKKRVRNELGDREWIFEGLTYKDTED